MTTVELLREMFRYEPVSGHLIWKAGKRVGKRAGSQQGKGGYRHVRVGDKYMYEHRIAMLLTLGEIPEDIQIDHVNHDKGDNRLANLRFTTHTQNGRNVKKISTNTTGVTGVTFCKLTGKYQAQIHMNGKCKYLGQYDTLEEAATARAEADKRYNFHPNHGL